MRKLVCLVGVLLLLLNVSLSARAETEDVEPYIRRMISYYRYYQEQAGVQIDTLLDYIQSLDPGKGALWKKIMDSWSWVNSEMEVNMSILPDGLPEDDSLCIVVLGYGLNGDGSMKQELIERLQVALASAKKYPNAYVLCTGGQTANAPGVSEAGQMGSWLLSAGLEKSRLILEEQSLSTAENAQNSYGLLSRNYPQVRSIAVITSDYHIRWGCAMFTTVRHWEVTRGGRDLELVGNAVCDTGNADYDSMDSQALGISQITGVDWEEETAPPLEPTVAARIAPEPEETAAATAETVQPVPEQETGEQNYSAFPVMVLITAAVVVGIGQIRRRK